MNKTDKNQKFIKTQDEGTKKTLESLGFTLLSYDGKTATFLNDMKLYDELDITNATYSNRLDF